MTATPAPPAGAPAGLLALLDRLEGLCERYSVPEVPAAELRALLTAARRGAETMQQQQQDQG